MTGQVKLEKFLLAFCIFAFSAGAVWFQSREYEDRIALYDTHLPFIKVQMQIRNVIHVTCINKVQLMIISLLV